MLKIRGWGTRRCTSAMVFGCLLHGLAGAAVPNSAEIVSITGKAESRQLASAPWSPAQNKQVLLGGHFVRTLDESSVALLFADKTQLRLSRNSMFEIKSVGDGASTDTSVSLLKGKSWMQSKSVPNKLKVETPSGTAGIHGTDWVMEVDDAGVTTLTVLSGEVEFANDQGSVRVRTDEQAVTVPGRAPQKRLLQNPKERVQWVTSHRTDVNAYADLRLNPQFQAIARDVDAQLLARARSAVEDMLAPAIAHPTAPAPDIPAGAWLLASDFAIAAGEFDLARQRLVQGQQRFPQDDRLVANQARVALLSGDWDNARRILVAAWQHFAQSAELSMVAGELARLDGDGPLAVRNFLDATQRAPKDYRTWLGLGATYAEQENFGPARDALQRAVELSDGSVAALSELGAFETRAQRAQAAAQALDRSLELAPDDYVAWTGKGVLLLSQGQPEAALEAFLKAGVLEPRYAKAQVHAAIAWYQLGRPDAALAALAKAKAMDPNDPLPYFYEAQIQRDGLDPMGAIAAARSAMERIGFLKSLGPIATDRQGNASLGAAYAMFGLESWAKRIAVQTQHPFFAGSYLFSAGRITDGFLKNSATIQGYLTDPTLFGASPQRSSLIASPGVFGTAELSGVYLDAYSSVTPSIIANGLVNSPMPMAGFVQWSPQRLQSGQAPLSGTAPSLVTAVGFRPSAQWGVFLYRDEFRPRFDTIDIMTANDRLKGDTTRTEVGTQWQINPATALWLRAGQGRDDMEVDSNVQTRSRTSSREDRDSGLRLTALRESGEWTVGLEGGKATLPSATRSQSPLFKTSIEAQVGVAGERLYGSWKGSSKEWIFQADIHYTRYRGDDSTSVFQTKLSNGRVTELRFEDVGLGLDEWSPNLGAAWTPVQGQTYRVAWQQTMRPVAPVSLGPLDTVGISYDVPGLQPGGRLKRLRVQGEWEVSSNAFWSAFADYRSIDNPHGPDGELLFNGTNTGQYDRLRQDGLPTLESPEALEGPTTFAMGTIRSVGFVYEQIATDHLSWSASYVHASTTNSVYFDRPLPRFAEHTLGFGMTWFAPSRWVVRGYLAGRSERTLDDRATQWLDPDWDLSASATWQDASKRRLFEVFAKGLARKDTSSAVGARVVWRF